MITLAVFVPSYNRPAELEMAVTSVLRDASVLPVKIYVSDDSDFQNYRAAGRMGAWGDERVLYRWNSKRLGHDGNVFSWIDELEEDYVFILADSKIVTEGSVRFFLEKLECLRPAIMTFNINRMSIELPEQFFTCDTDEQKNLLLEDFLWHLTITGVCIYSTAAVRCIQDGVSYDSFPNFPQIGYIYNIIGEGGGLLWCDRICVEEAKNKSSYWQSKVFEVFLRDLWCSIESLPSVFSDKSRLRSLRNHAKRAKILTFSSLIMYRGQRSLYWLTFFRTFGELFRISWLSTLKVIFSLFLPQAFCCLIVELISKARVRRRGVFK